MKTTGEALDATLTKLQLGRLPAACAEVTEAEAHLSSLRNVLMCATSTFHPASVFEDNLASVRGYMARGVPCGKTSKMALQPFLAPNWRTNSAVSSLFDSYVKAGYIDVNSYATHILPLEAAIGLGNLDAVLALLDNGADETLIPSAGNEVPCGSPGDAMAGDDAYQPEPYKDVFDYVDGECANQKVIPEMVAALMDCSMRRRIGSPKGAESAGTARARLRV